MTTREHERLLSPIELGAIILLVLPIFLFVSGPIWTHSFALDGAIGWSYLPIPLLVALALARRHVLSFAGFLANTTMALSAKYLLTLSIAMALWIAFGPPPPASEVPALSSAPARIDRDEDARAPATKLSLGQGGSGPITPIESGATIAFESHDRSLHTVRGTQAGRIIFHLPIVPGRTSQPITLGAEGRIDLSCAVHPDERYGAIWVVRPMPGTNLPARLQ